MLSTTNISFPYTLTRKVVKNCRFVTEELPLRVSAVGHFDPFISSLHAGRYSATIEAVYYEEKNIREVLEFLDCMDEIVDAAEREASVFFNRENAHV